MTPVSAFRGAPAALALLTRIPVPTRWHVADSSAAVPWMPAVGLVIGLFVAGAWRVCQPLGSAVAAVSVLTLSVLVTGALHEDGLADTADALGGATSSARVFEILKDSRIGSFGAVATALSVAWRLVLLVTLGSRAPVALVVSHTLARLAPVWLLSTLPYVTPRPVSKSRIQGKSSVRMALFATAFAVTALGAAIWLGGLTPWLAAAVLLASAGVTAVLGRYFFLRCGGITGDFLGATEQVIEVVTLLVSTAH